MYQRGYMDKKTLFIKPSRSFAEEQVKLDPVLVASNKASNIETTLLLDTNIIISMEKVVKYGNKWASVKQQGLHNLVRLLQRCPPQSIAISPGSAIDEMPPQLGRQARIAYDQFCAKHLSWFVDAPNCEKVEPTGEFETYGFTDLPNQSKAALSIMFSCVIYLNIVDRFIDGSREEKFTAYLDFLTDKVGYLSATEIEVAKYCLWEPPATSREIIKVRQGIRANFLKTNQGKSPRSKQDILDVAYNAARDIFLLHIANIVDTHGVDGVRQDVWIVTKDKKLSEFCKLFHHVNIDGQAGKGVALAILPEQENDPFWTFAVNEFAQRHDARMAFNRLRNPDISEGELIDIAEQAIKELDIHYKDT